MTREAALRELCRLACGLGPDLVGERRLLERIAATDTAEELRAALLELGAARLLDELAGGAA